MEIKNRCRTDIISMCDCEKNGDQKKCSFFEYGVKDQSNQCYWLKFDDFCSNTKAQEDYKNTYD
jgi:hypothetical protein